MGDTINKFKKMVSTTISPQEAVNAFVKPEVRKEKDTLGEVEVPCHRYWGPQTQRCYVNFCVGDENEEAMPKLVIHSLGHLKLACALANWKFGRLSTEVASSIILAAHEVSIGRLDDEFPLRWVQTGSGTQSNMNANEVISKRATELIKNFELDLSKLTLEKVTNHFVKKIPQLEIQTLLQQMESKFVADVTKRPPIPIEVTVHPNDQVNLGQSSNDVFPTVMHLTVAQALHLYLLPRLKMLSQTLQTKVDEFAYIVKIGRTHLMDATPVTLGQEVSAWKSVVDHHIIAFEENMSRIYLLAQGGTAVGTGLNTVVGFDVEVADILKNRLGLDFKSHPNKFHALSLKDGCATVHTEVAALASSVFKIAQDIRLLASGPRCGLGELQLPENEPGSSIMPGKINPTQCEAMTMICTYVLGNNGTILMANSQGHMQLNVFKPLMTMLTYKSIRLLGEGIAQFTDECVKGMKSRNIVIDELKNKSLMLVTCLTPIIGYDVAGKCAVEAHHKNLSLKEVVVDLKKLMTSEEFDLHVQAEKMLKPK